MSLILDGTNGLSDVDGSASTPAIRGTDANTGIFFPAADTIAFAEGGAEVARFDSSGNLGIGTSSPAHRLDVQAASSVARFQSTTGTQPAYLYVTNTGGDFYFGRNNSTGSSFGGDGYSANIYSAGAYPMVFFTNGTERMRIDSNGSLLVGSTTSNVESGVGFKFVKSGTTPYMGIVVDGNVSNYHYYNVNAVNNGYRFYVNANGGISNYSGNNVNLSDERTKTNIELASSYLDKICAIPVKTFNYKDEPTGEQKTLGVIAQDVEVVAPEFVDKDGWKGTAPEGEEPLKSIYTTDLMFALMKSIQEQQQIINDLKLRIETLENK